MSNILQVIFYKFILYKLYSESYILQLLFFFNQEVLPLYCHILEEIFDMPLKVQKIKTMVHKGLKRNPSTTKTHIILTSCKSTELYLNSS